MSVPRRGFGFTRRVAAPFRSRRRLGCLDPVAFVQQLPVYPPELEARGVAGRAVVELVIDDGGRVRDVQLVRATHPEFGSAALAVAKQWQFRPAVKLGQPVEVRVQLPIDFNPRRPRS